MAGSANSALGPRLRCPSALLPGPKVPNRTGEGPKSDSAPSEQAAWQRVPSRPAGQAALDTRTDGTDGQARAIPVPATGTLRFPVAARRGYSVLATVGLAARPQAVHLPLLRGRPHDHRAPGRPSCPVTQRPWRVPLPRLPHPGRLPPGGFWPILEDFGHRQAGPSRRSASFGQIRIASVALVIKAAGQSASLIMRKPQSSTLAPALASRSCVPSLARTTAGQWRQPRRGRRRRLPGTARSRRLSAARSGGTDTAGDPSSAVPLRVRTLPSAGRGALPTASA